MKITKNYIRYDGDGFSGERKLEQDSAGIRLETTFETQLVPFIMDEEQERFIVFMIPRKNDISLLLWVFLPDDKREWPHGERIRLTHFDELTQYFKWSGDPLNVSGKYPESIISRAYALLQSLTIEKSMKMILELVEKESENEFERKSRKDFEISLMKDIRAAKRDNHGILGL